MVPFSPVDWLKGRSSNGPVIFARRPCGVASLLGLKSYFGSSLSLPAGVTPVTGSTGGNAKLPSSRITKSMPSSATSCCNSAWQPFRPTSAAPVS